MRFREILTQFMDYKIDADEYFALLRTLSNKELATGLLLVARIIQENPYVVASNQFLRGVSGLSIVIVDALVPEETDKTEEAMRIAKLKGNAGLN